MNFNLDHCGIALLYRQILEDYEAISYTCLIRPALLHTRATQHVTNHEKQIYIKVLRLHNKKQIYKRMTLHRHHEKHEAATNTTRLIITAFQSFHGMLTIVDKHS